MAAAFTAALALALALQASADGAPPSPIHLAVRATPGLAGPAPFWVELDATGTTTADPTSDWVRDFHFAASDGAETDLGVFDHTFVEPGRYTVTVSARDADGNRVDKTLTVEVSLPAGSGGGAPLTLHVDADPGYRGTAPFWVHLDAGRSATTAPGDWIYAYHWSASDGATASTAVFDHLFDAPGRYTIHLAVDDLFGQHVTWTQIIQVGGDPQETPPPRRVVLPAHRRVPTDPGEAEDPAPGPASR